MALKWKKFLEEIEHCKEKRGIRKCVRRGKVSMNLFEDL
jgi:hypothetical protein